MKIIRPNQASLRHAWPAVAQLTMAMSIWNSTALAMEPLGLFRKSQWLLTTNLFPTAVALSGSRALSAIMDAQSSTHAAQFFDVTQFSNPVPVSQIPIRGTVYKILWRDHLAYLLAQEPWFKVPRLSSLQMIDYSRPQLPVLLTTIVATDQLRDFDVLGSRLYLARASSPPAEPPKSALEIYDVTDPARLRLLGRIETNQIFTAVQVMGNYACVGTDGIEFQTFNITDPGNPAWTDSYSTYVETFFEHHGYGVSSLTRAGDRLYSAGENGFQTFTISPQGGIRRLNVLADPLLKADVAGCFAYYFYELPGAFHLFIANSICPKEVTVLPVVIGNNQARVLDGGFEENRAVLATVPDGLLFFEWNSTPTLTHQHLGGGQIRLSWAGEPNLVLQYSEILPTSPVQSPLPLEPDWKTVPLSNGRSEIDLDIGPDARFYRLFHP